MAQELLNTKWISPEIVCSYPHLHEMSADLNGNMSFNISIPLPKTNQAAVDKLREVMKNAAINKWGEKAAGLEGIKHHVVDGSPDDDTYINTLKFSAKSRRKPGVVDQFKRPVPDDQIEAMFYPGAIIRVSVNAYAVETTKEGTNIKIKTIAFSLNNVMFVRDGIRLGGASRAEDDFAEFGEAMNDDFAETAAGPLF
jgi:hypothetical protein